MVCTLSNGRTVIAESVLSFITVAVSVSRLRQAVYSTVCFLVHIQWLLTVPTDPVQLIVP